MTMKASQCIRQTPTEHKSMLQNKECVVLKWLRNSCEFLMLHPYRGFSLYHSWTHGPGSDPSYLRVCVREILYNNIYIYIYVHV